ncbi:MAG TPA: MFS transporter [Actinospica sp.]|jgi:MFS family permease|nr:MFS transporter [Actinospica sp.]
MTTMTEQTGTDTDTAALAATPQYSSTDAGSAHAASGPRHSAALRTIYAGGFTAFFGLAIAEVVFPLLILGFTGKPLLAGMFGSIQFAALVLASVPAGSFIDRHDRRRILIVSETLRAALATALAVSLAAGHVWLVEIYLIAAVLGACQPFSGVRTLALRAVAPADRLTGALSMQQAVSAVAQLAGPALGTVLFAVNRSLPFAAVALGTGISAACAYFVRFDARPQPEPETAGATLDADTTADAAAKSQSPFAGISIVWRHPVMRAAMIFIMLLNLVSVPLDLVLIVQARREGVPTHFLGLILASFAAGGILGAPFIPRLHALLRPGRLLSILGVLVTVGCAAMALPFGGFWMAGWLAAIGFVIPAVQVLVDVLILQQVPDAQRGRVLGAVMTFIGLGLPLGAAFGGGLLQLLSPATVLLGTAGALTCVTLYAVSQRDLRRAEWPTAS